MIKILSLLAVFGALTFTSPAMAGGKDASACNQAVAADSCTADSHCGIESRCIGGECVPFSGLVANPGDSCTHDNGCGIEERCIGGECVPFSGLLSKANVAADTCTHDAHCGIESRCIGGECVPFSGR